MLLTPVSPFRRHQKNSALGRSAAPYFPIHMKEQFSSRQSERPDEEALEVKLENQELVNRYRFRFRVKRLLEMVDSPGVLLPNKDRLKQVLNEALSSVPPYSEREEEWLDHELAIERGDIVGASQEDDEWVRKHPRF